MQETSSSQRLKGRAVRVFIKPSDFGNSMSSSRLLGLAMRRNGYHAVYLNEKGVISGLTRANIAFTSQLTPAIRRKFRRFDCVNDAARIRLKPFSFDLMVFASEPAVTAQV